MNGRTYKMKRLIILAAILILLMLSALPLLRAQSGLSLLWSNFSSGYGISSGNGFTVAGTSGEIDGGPSLSGDDISMTGGFWSGVDEPPPMGPTPTPPPTSTPAPTQYRLYLPNTIK